VHWIYCRGANETAELKVQSSRCLTLVPADAHPCALNYPVMPARVLVRQSCPASGGGWARLNLAVSGPSAKSKVAHRRRNVHTNDRRLKVKLQRVCQLQCHGWGVLRHQGSIPCTGRYNGSQRAATPHRGRISSRIPEMVESGACPGQWHGREGSLNHGRCTGVSSTTQRRVARNAILCERTLKTEAGPTPDADDCDKLALHDDHLLVVKEMRSAGSHSERASFGEK